MIHGVDLSGNVQSIDMGALAASEDFFYHQATDGVGTVDKMLMVRANEIRAAGKGDAFGCYHFLRVRHGHAQDADEQCKQFLDARMRAGCTLPPWFDVELGEEHSSNRAATHDEVRAAVELFLETWEQSLGGALFGYSSPGEMNIMGLDKVDAFTSLPLALAEYVLPPGQAPATPPMSPKLPAPYTSWSFWQYGGDVPRYSGIVDLVLFNGTLAQLQKM